MTIENFAQSKIPVIIVIPPINLYHKPEYTDTQQIHYEVGIKKQDQDLLRRAAEFDYASRRITPSLQKALLEICEQYENSVQCVDMRYIEEDNTQKFFVDFCHPTFDYGVNAIVQSILPHVE